MRASLAWRGRVAAALTARPPLPPPSSDNNLGEAGGAAIGKALETNSTLTYLDVHCAPAPQWSRVLPAGRGVVGACRAKVGVWGGQGGRCVCAVSVVSVVSST